MNICYMLSCFSGGGIGRVTSILLNRLCKNKNDRFFALCYYDSEVVAPITLDATIIRHSIFTETISVQKALLKKHLLRTVEEFIKRNKIDVIIACGAMFYPVCCLAAKRCRIPFVCWEHTSPDARGDYRFQMLSRVFGAKRSDLNIVLTQKALDAYNVRFPKSRNVKIPNPTDPKLFEDPRPYAAESKKIISVGRLSPQKNFSRLLDIAALVLPEHPGWTWDVYGVGKQREMLENKGAALQLTGRVNFRGQSKELYSVYSEYSFLVMTSDWEGFPMTLLEGGAKGLPLLAFDVPTGPSEIISDGENGYLCSRNDVGAMVERINRLIEDAPLRCRMSDAAKEKALEYDIEGICTLWEHQLEIIRAKTK